MWFHDLKSLTMLKTILKVGAEEAFMKERGLFCFKNIKRFSALNLRQRFYS